MAGDGQGGGVAQVKERVFRAFRAALPALLVGVIVPGAFLFGYVVRGPGARPASSEGAGAAREMAWTCSMHPQVRRTEPGKCPICHMDLIPLEEREGAGPPQAAVFQANASARELMRIQTVAAARQRVSREVRMVGKVAFDETRVAYITAWFPGRLDRLYVDYTGMEVRKGDHLGELYSPELLAAQQDLRRAAAALEGMRVDAPEVLRKTAETTAEAARERLRRWGLTDRQIDQAEKEGITSEHVTIYAPISGTVIHRDGQEGMYVDTGTRIYTIADLSSVWVKLDAYESDLPWLRYGQQVEFTTEAFPGEVFSGRISFIDPTLDTATRTANLRVIVRNEGGRLKPEMFVRAVARVEMTVDGRVVDADLAGKWISPMHPEIVKNGPGTCDVCGMPLVRAEELGYAAPEPAEREAPLVIPATAPLITGVRAVVYVETQNDEGYAYEGRDVVLGARAGDFYVVAEGLEEGERVVVNGAFKIDSALQIQAKRSMMSEPSEAVEEAHMHAGAMEMPSMEGGGTMQIPAEKGGEIPEAFRAQVGAFYEAYAGLVERLAGDDLVGARKAIAQAKTALGSVEMGLLSGAAHQEWMAQAMRLGEALAAMAGAEDIEEVRVPLADLSAALISVVERFGMDSELAAYRAHCPMALGNQGADWVQPGEEVRNPYYGASMLACGEIVGPLAGPDEPGGEP